MEPSHPITGTAIRDCERLVRFSSVPRYGEFFERCLLPNRPCILPASLVAPWEVVRSNAWGIASSSSSDTQVNWDALRREYGAHVSPVVVTRLNAAGQVEETRTDMTIANAVELIQRLQRGECDDVRSVYIKDWHLVKQSSPQREEAPYTVPDIFADDWMDHLASSTGKDDFRFVYAGTAGSHTLLHRDVYASYSWSTNVVGRKRWFLFPPHAVPHLRRFPAVATSELVPNISALLTIVAAQPQGRREWSQLETALSHMQIIDQQPHETIFIPSNWHHQVDNQTDCISINRNWCNATNVPSLYEAIKEELAHAEDALEDVKELLSSGQEGDEWKREFYTLVQNIAVQDAGWAWAGFWDMLRLCLSQPPAREGLRPGEEWVRERLSPLVRDFEAREDAKWLDAGIRETAEECRKILEGNG